jgi:hypothetical protein
MAQEQQAEFEIQVPPELEAGAHANFLMVWHTPHDFTLDFAVMQPSQPGSTTVPCRVVARLRLPPSVMVDVVQAMSENISRYQQSFGEIQRPGQQGGGATVDRTTDRPGAGGYH